MNKPSDTPRTFRFDVLRYAATAGAPPRFQSYELTIDRQTSVLEAILRIQDEQDPTLAFRYACRGAICGSCAMSINGKLNLACRVQLYSLPGDRVVLEPLPGFDVLKDLVVNLEAFWEKYRRVHPWLEAELGGSCETRMSEAQRARIDQFVHCILCGVCYAACPARRKNEEFTGPAALAKLYRFVADSRQGGNHHAALREADSPTGLWGCRNVMRCTEACPKEVRPSDGVRGARRELLKRALRRTK